MQLPGKKENTILHPAAVPVSDEELLSAFRKSGDSNLVGELYKRYMHLVFGVCMKYLKNTENSKDAVMQIFEWLLTALRNQEIRNFKGWLYTVVRNHCLMQLRKEKTWQKVFTVEKEKMNEEYMESEDALHLLNEDDTEKNSLRLIRALDLLNGEQKRCIELKYFEDKSYEEVTAITGFNMNQVKSHIQNGKRNLWLILKREEE